MKRIDYDTPGELYIQNAMRLLDVGSQSQLARKTGCYVSQISRIRKGEIRFLQSLFLTLLAMTDKRPSELFAALGMPTDYFFR